MSYGKSISIDLHGCNADDFTRRKLRQFVLALCDYIKMTPAKRVWWDYRWSPWAKREAPAHLKGTSLVQFIQTSTIVIHTLDDLGTVYIDLFSCSTFSATDVIYFCKNWFGGKVVNHSITERF
ncbi:MAG: S-adenosylmethionine decarboxylase [Candidatus Marinimicrobia bacterium]|nr:S-adenosylmethionine decarboxylase [Candidatus Neomarinimicrobiota bacterium]